MNAAVPDASVTVTNNFFRGMIKVTPVPEGTGHIGFAIVSGTSTNGKKFAVSQGMSGLLLIDYDGKEYTASWFDIITELFEAKKNVSKRHRK